MLTLMLRLPDNGTQQNIINTIKGTFKITKRCAAHQFTKSVKLHVRLAQKYSCIPQAYSTKKKYTVES